MNHELAKALVDGLEPPLTEAESLFVRMVAFAETGYGEGWKEGEGKGSNNWGAITFKPKGEAIEGECRGGFAHEDSAFDPKTGRVERYVTCFKSYATDREGAEDVVRLVLKPNVREALRSLSVRAGVAAMHANKYFLGTKPTAAENVDDYTRFLTRALGRIKEATGEPDPFVPTGEEESELTSPGVPSSGLLFSCFPAWLSGAEGRVG